MTETGLAFQGHWSHERMKVSPEAHPRYGAMRTNGIANKPASGALPCFPEPRCLPAWRAILPDPSHDNPPV